MLKEPANRRNSGGLPVDGHLGLAKRRVAAALKVGRFIARHAEVPELVVRLALRDDVEVHPLDVARQIEGPRDLVGRRVERAGVASGAVDRHDDIGRTRSGMAA